MTWGILFGIAVAAGVLEGLIAIGLQIWKVYKEIKRQ